MLTQLTQQNAKQRLTFFQVTASIQQRELRFGMAPLCYKLSIVCVVEFTAKHFLLFACPVNFHNS
jgi:hypothetical protein